MCTKPSPVRETSFTGARYSAVTYIVDAWEGSPFAFRLTTPANNNSCLNRRPAIARYPFFLHRILFELLKV